MFAWLHIIFLRRAALDTMVNMATKEELRRLAANVAAATSTAERAAAHQALGDALEPHSSRHARVSFAKSVQATHRTDDKDPGTRHVLPPARARQAARAQFIRMPALLSVNSTLRALHAQQDPPDCGISNVLLVPVWPCCEGLASRAHTLASGLAQAAWHGQVALPFLAGCDEPASCELQAHDETMNLLLPLSTCTIATALDDTEFAHLRNATRALTHNSPHDRPGARAAALLLPPGSRRVAALGAEAAACSVTLLANEHAANAAALLPPPSHAPTPPHAHTTTHGPIADADAALLWAATTLAYVLTPHPEVWSTSIEPLLLRLHHSRVHATPPPAGPTRGVVGTPRLVAVHVRHGDKAYEPWKSPRVPLRAYLRHAADAVTRWSAADFESNPSSSSSRRMDGAYGVLMVASDNGTLLTDVQHALAHANRPSCSNSTAEAIATSILPSTSTSLPTALRGLHRAAWPSRAEGDSLPRLSQKLRAHNSAPSVIFFSAHRPLQRRLAIGALSDLIALSEADVFVGSASSHYSAVAGLLRLVRGAATLLPSVTTAHTPASTRHSPPPPSAPIYVDERPLALEGAYSVGLLHAANLKTDATAAEKADRWRTAARRLEASAALETWPSAVTSTRTGSEDAEGGDECRVSAAHGVRWRHSPAPAPRVSPAALACVWKRVWQTCPAWSVRGVAGM